MGSKQGRTKGFPIRGVGCSKIYRQNQLNNRAFLRMERFTDEINYTIAHFYVWSDTIMELSKRGQTCRTILDAMNLKITDRLSLKTDNYQLCINLPTILKKLGGCYTPPHPPARYAPGSKLRTHLGPVVRRSDSTIHRIAIFFNHCKNA